MRVQIPPAPNAASAAIESRSVESREWINAFVYSLLSTLYFLSSTFSLRDWLTVGRRSLEPIVKVRILLPELDGELNADSCVVVNTISK